MQFGHHNHVTRHLLASTLFIVCAGAATALAQTPPATPAPQAAPAPAPSGPSVKVGGTLFADYTYTSSPESADADGRAFHPQAFNVTRSYLNITGTLSRAIAFRFTPDIARETGSGSSLNGSLVFRVKYAYVQANFDQWMASGSWARLGVQQTPLVDFQEGIYRYRFQGTMFEEREGFLSSSDAGASFHYNLPRNSGDLHVGVYNGETYRKAEVNDQKALEMRGTVRPFAAGGPVLKGLRVTGYYRADHYVRNAERTRAVVGATFEHKYINTGYDYLRASDQISVSAAQADASGYSFWATPRAGNGWEGLLRVDRLTPNRALPGQTRTRTIVGAAYWMPVQSGVSSAFLLDYDRLKTTGLAQNPPSDTRIALHALVSF